MGILDGQPVSAAITNPAFINKNQNDNMPNVLGFDAASEGSSIASIQKAVNKLYTASGASESATGTVYNATAGTISNGDSYQTALTKLADKFDASTGHMHTGAAGDGPVLSVVLSIAVTGSSPLTGNLVFVPGTNVSINQAGNILTFSSSSSTSIAVSGNTPLVGAVTFTAGSGVQLNQSGQNIAISATGHVDSIAVTGNSGINGNIVFIPGSGITLTQVGQDITIAASGGGGSSPLTTKGDLWGYDTTNDRVPVGSDGQILMADSAQSLGVRWASLFIKNALINSDFYWAQRSTSGTLGNGSSAYIIDRWYAKNSLGTNGVLTYSQIAGTLSQSLFAAKLQITTAPTAAQTNGTELYQVLENADSILFFNQTACFSCNVKSLGNVNQVGIQFFYATTETKLTTAIGSEVTFTVNSSTFTLGSIVGQALGTSQTTAGVVGVRIRITGVSTGNLYDLNNGFIVEQCMMHLGSTLLPWRKAGNTISDELELCRRFLFIMNSVDNSNARFGPGVVAAANAFRVQIAFPVQMRTVPTLSFTTASNFLTNIAGSNVSVSAIADNGTTSRFVASIAVTVSGQTAGQAGELTGNNTSAKITADSEI